MIPIKVSSAPLTAMVLMIALLWIDASMPGHAQTSSPTPGAGAPTTPVPRRSLYVPACMGVSCSVAGRMTMAAPFSSNVATTV